MFRTQNTRLLEIYGQGTSIFFSSMATEPVDVVAEDASASESDEDHSSLEMGTSEGSYQTLLPFRPRFRPCSINCAPQLPRS